MDQKFVDDSSNLWKTTENSLLKDIEGTLIFYYDCTEAVQSYHNFYQQLLEFWEPISVEVSNEVEFILTQNLWNNRYIYYVTVGTLCLVVFFKYEVLIICLTFLTFN